MPTRDFTLERAFAAVLRNCGVELDDQTEYESPKAEKAKRTYAPVQDENIFYEFAKHISNGDENVLSEVFTHEERWEVYAQNDAGEGAHRDDVRWLSMLNTLKKHGYAEEADGNEDAESISLRLDRIKSKLNVTLDTASALDMLGGGEEIETLETPRLLSLIGLALDGQRWCLCNIDTISGEGAYTLCLLPRKAYKQCEKLLRDTKFSLSPF